MENEHDLLIKEYLLKHFDAVEILPEKAQINVLCYLGEYEYRFPFCAIHYYQASPYDVVNSIWEYINSEL